MARFIFTLMVAAVLVASGLAQRRNPELGASNDGRINSFHEQIQNLQKIYSDLRRENKDVEADAVRKQIDEKMRAIHEDDHLAPFNHANGGRADPEQLKKHDEDMKALQRSYADLRRDHKDAEADEVMRKMNEKIRSMHELHHAPAPFVPRLDPTAMKSAQEEVMALQREYGRLHREGHTKEADELRIKIDLKMVSMYDGAFRDPNNEAGQLTGAGSAGQNRPSPETIRARQEEIQALQKRHVELRESNMNEEAEKVQREIGEKIRSMHELSTPGFGSGMGNTPPPFNPETVRALQEEMTEMRKQLDTLRTGARAAHSEQREGDEKGVATNNGDNENAVRALEMKINDKARALHEIFTAGRNAAAPRDRSI